MYQLFSFTSNAILCYLIRVNLYYLGGLYLNEKNNTTRIRSFFNTASEKFMGMNKGSKILLKIGTSVLAVFLLVALALEILLISGTIVLQNHLHLIEWTMLYSFRFWVMIVFGAFILDILVKR
jgi:hypothetical protein